MVHVVGLAWSKAAARRWAALGCAAMQVARQGKGHSKQIK